MTYRHSWSSWIYHKLNLVSGTVFNQKSLLLIRNFHPCSCDLENVGSVLQVFTLKKINSLYG